jgi:general secretion pathway protein M
MSAAGSLASSSGSSSSQRQRRRCLAVLVAIVFVPLALATLVGLVWLERMQTLESGIQGDLDRLQRYQRLVATLPALRQALAEEQSNDAFKAYYFDADTPAIAGAQLQREVQDMVRNAGARPVSAQVLPSDEQDDPPRVRVRIQLQGTTEQLFDVLYRVESARPFLLIDQLSIRSQARSNQRRGRQRVRGAPRPAQQDQLTVRLDIFGYFLGTSG